MRNLINSENELDNYPIGNSPQNNQTLFFENGQFLYKFLSPSGISFSSEGTGISIIKQFLNNNLELKSILGDGNVIASSLSNEVGLSLSNNIKFGDQDILITDEGLSILKTLYFRAKYGILNSIPMSINNQGRIDIFGPMYLNSIAVGTPNNNEFLTLDIDNKIVRSSLPIPSGVLTDIANLPATPLGSGLDVFRNISGTTANLRTLKVGNGILGNVNTNEITFSINPSLDNIAAINSSTPLVNLGIYSTNLAFPQIPNSVAALGTKCLYINEATKNIFYSDNIKTLTTIGSGNTLLNPTGLSEYPILKKIEAGSGISISTTNETLTINNTAVAGSNIYNSDGTMNSNQRIVSGLNPNDIASNILWDGIIPGYNSTWMTPTNVPIADDPYQGIYDPTLMMCATSNGSQSKFLYAPHNYLSQKIEFKLVGSFGHSKIVYGNFSNINGSKDFIFQVDLYEIENYLDAYAATWEFSLNSRLGGAFHVKPKTSTRLNYTGSENCVGLIIRTTSGIGGSGWEIIFQQQGLGTGAYTSKYIAFIRCNNLGDGSMNIYDNDLVIPLAETYLNDPVLLFETGISFPIPYQFSYKEFGRDLKLTYNGTAQQAIGNGGLFIFRVFFNGVEVIAKNISTDSVTNVNTNVTFTRILKYTELVNNGALNLGSPTQITWTLSSNNIRFTNLPYEVLLEYI